MVEPANEDEFRGVKQAANLQRAMGYKDDAKTRIGGIVKPEKSRLIAGDVIFRLGNKARSFEEDRHQAWWLLPSTLEYAAQYADNAQTFIDILRQNLAIPPAFSPMDRVFGASVEHRLSAFSGVGSGVFRQDLVERHQGGAPPLLLGGMEHENSARGVSRCYQLFIPGLATCGRDALKYGPVRTTMEWFNRPTSQRQWP